MAVVGGLISVALGSEHGLSSCDTCAELLHGMWDPLRPGIEPVSSVSAGGFFTTEPTRKTPHTDSLSQV